MNEDVKLNLKLKLNWHLGVKIKNKLKFNLR